MKKTIFIALAALMVGCGNGESPEAIRTEIGKLKDKQLEINHQVKELEKKLKVAEGDDVTNGFVPVLVQQIELQPFEHYFLVNGSVELVEEAQVSPEANGQITKIFVTKGQKVRKGDILVSLNTEMLKNSIAEVKLGLELSSKIFDKQQELWDQKIGSELQYLEAKNAKESLEHRLKTLESQLDMSIISAPFNGIVDDIFLKEGEMASPGRPILYLINLDKFKVIADISESFLPKIKQGDMVTIKFPTYDDIKLSAPIHRIGNSIDTKTRTVKLEVRLDNINGRIKPNQIASLNIRDFAKDQAIVVPSLVVKQDNRGEFLFVAEKDENGSSIARKIYIETGLSYTDQTMVTKGLTVGQNVIVAGFNQVGNGSLVEIR